MSNILDIVSRKELARGKPTKGPHRSVVGVRVVKSEVFAKISKGEETVGGIESPPSSRRLRSTFPLCLGGRSEPFQAGGKLKPVGTGQRTGAEKGRAGAGRETDCRTGRQRFVGVHRENPHFRC